MNLERGQIYFVNPKTYVKGAIALSASITIDRAS